MEKNHRTEQMQRGSVLVYILLAVILFAALGYAVSGMMRSTSESISDEKSRILATEIENYARSIKEAIRILKISNDCDDTDISFENTIVSGYEHSPAAEDQCKIFHQDGGGLSYIRPSEDILDSAYSSELYYGEWYFPSDLLHDDVPSGAGWTGQETTAFLPYIKERVCRSINETLGVINPGDAIPVDAGKSYFENLKYQGIPDTGATDGAVNLSGVFTGCYQAHASSTGSAAPGSYVFFQILIPR